jgi:hypothetical protein
MTLTIGRCSGLRPAKMGISWDGDDLTIRGTIVTASNNELRARRQQLLGLIDNDDEDVFPVVYASDSALDGYYRVRSVNVSPVGVLSGRLANFAVGLRRVVGYRTPIVELVASSVGMTNEFGITNPQGYLAFPQAGQGVGGYNGELTRSSETGGLWLTGANANASFAVQYMLAAASYYFGAATIEVLYGATWYPAVGNQISADATSVRLSNGCLRVSISATGVFTLEIWNGSAWETGAVTVSLRESTTLALDTLSQIRVVRNSPEVCTLRLEMSQSADVVFANTTVDLTLRRGMHHVDLAMSAGIVPLTSPTIGATTTMASTSVTSDGYLVQTANDASGNRLVLGMPVTGPTGAFDLVNGRVTQAGIAGLTNLSAMMGLELNGTSSVAPNRAADLRDQHLRAIAVQQRVQVR